MLLRTVRTLGPLRCAVPLPRLKAYAPVRLSSSKPQTLSIFFPRFKEPDIEEREFFKGNSDNVDPRKQQKLANLGTIIEIIKHHVPQLLQQPLPKEIISDAITLRVLPVTHPSLPAAQGRVAYNAVFKTLQLFCSSVLLPPHSRLVILAARLPLNDDDDSPEFTRRKFVVRWRSENSNTSTSPREEYPDSFSSRGTEALAPQQLARTLGLLSHEYPVLTGLFEFQFDQECTQIEQIVISDVEYISREQDVKCVAV